MTEEKNISTEINTQEANAIPTTHHHKRKRKSKMMYIFITIFAIAVIILGVVYYQKNIAGNGKQQIVEKALKYINDNLSGGTKLELGTIDKDSKSFYRFTVKAGDREIPTYVSTDGKVMTYNEVDISKIEESKPTEATTDNTVNTFTEVKENEICKENGKPIIYFFGSKTCPHCEWEKPIIEEVIKSYGDKISFHENIDSEKDKDVFSKFNKEGGIPTIIIGCKYYRIGSGEADGADKEKENLKTVIDLILK